MTSRAYKIAIKAVANMEEKPRKSREKTSAESKKCSEKISSATKTKAPRKRKSGTKTSSTEKKTAESNSSHQQDSNPRQTEESIKTANVQIFPSVRKYYGEWMQYVHSNQPTIRDNELISLAALISYIAHTTRRAEFSIERQFSDRFNIPNLKCLPMDRYDDAVRYLVNLVPNDSN